MYNFDADAWVEEIILAISPVSLKEDTGTDVDSCQSITKFTELGGHQQC